MVLSDSELGELLPSAKSDQLGLFNVQFQSVHGRSPVEMCDTFGKPKRLNMSHKKKKISHRLLKSAARELIAFCGALRQRRLLNPIKPAYGRRSVC